MNTPHLLMLLAQARHDELRRAAHAHDRHQRRSQTRSRTAPALDGTEPPGQPILLAEVDGQLCTALSLSDGTVVVDPFHLRAGLIELLRERARQLEGPRLTRRRRRSRRSPEAPSR